MRKLSRNVWIGALMGFAIGFGVSFLPSHKTGPDHDEYARKHPTTLPVRCTFGLLGAVVMGLKEHRSAKSDVVSTSKET